METEYFRTVRWGQSFPRERGKPLLQLLPFMWECGNKMAAPPSVGSIFLFPYTHTHIHTQIHIHAYTHSHTYKYIFLCNIDFLSEFIKKNSLFFLRCNQCVFNNNNSFFLALYYISSVGCRNQLTMIYKSRIPY